jgi:MFS family permease
MQLKALLTCFAAALFFFYAILSLSVFNTIGITGIMEYYSLTQAQLGLLSSGYLYANAIFLIPAGLIFDRYSTRNIMLISMFLAILGIYGVFCTHSVYIAFAARCLSGIASAFVILGVIRSGIMWFAQRAGFVISTMIAFGMLGGYCSSLLYTVTDGNWIVLLQIVGAIGIGIILFMFICFKDNPIPKPQLSNGNNLGLFKKALLSKQSWLCGLYVGFMNLPVFLLGSLFGADYLVDKYAISNMIASRVSANIFIGVMLGSPIFGFLADYYKSYKKFLYAGAIISLVVIVVLIMQPSLNLLLLNVLFFILGIAIASQVLIYPLVARTNQTEIISTAQGLASTLNNLLGALMQTLFGYILVVFSTNLSHGFIIAMMIFPVSFLLSIVITKNIKE